MFGHIYILGLSILTIFNSLVSRDVNSYLSQHVPIFGQLVPDLWSTRICPKSTRTRVKKQGRVEHMIDVGLVSLGPNKPFSNTKASQFTICVEVRFVPACSKIPTLMPMGRPSGSLFNQTPSLQLSICDRTRFRPAVASSLTFSLWGGVPISLLKRPNQHSFAICDKAQFWLACSNF